ncbi:hypothetical protein P0D69_00910 [Paraburkholderia sediminicola]
MYLSDQLRFSVGPKDHRHPVVEVDHFAQQVDERMPEVFVVELATACCVDNETVYPRGEKMISLTLSLPLPAEILRLQNRLWAQLKAGR